MNFAFSGWERTLVRTLARGAVALACAFVCVHAQLWPQTAQKEAPQARAMRRFLARHGWSPAKGIAPRATALRPGTQLRAQSAVRAQGSSSGTWTALGPTAVSTSSFGLVTGRVTAIAIDPNDSSGNHVYIGTTGGGVWMAENAATSSASSVAFTALTDSLSALSGATDSSISIGAVAVQPGNADVVLAGTGDTNDLSSSYYGAGILRSTDGGNSWSLITKTKDLESGLGISDYSFIGEGFSGFAWSTTNTSLVVAAVSDAYEGLLVNAQQLGKSSRGLYYSTDAGASWHMATMEDSSTSLLQGPTMAIAGADGNAVTSVVWNPIRKMFFAAVRFHGYYQSSDGVTWTRMSSQPGTRMTSKLCPANTGTTGSTGCPIYRGTLAVNPTTGDTFAWSVDSGSLDQGLWQDSCSLTSGSCSSSTVSFSTEISTTALESSLSGGTNGIVDGLYTLALAAVPYLQDTILLAGDDDVWRCSLAAGCSWRNTTNTATCMTAMVGPYQHALVFNPSNSEEILIGNDSGLWRSMDMINQSGSTCITADASHYDNLNAGLGSLADVESISPVLTSPYVMMAGLGVNGVAGVKATSVTADWPQILSGYGGPVAVDASDTSKWYVNDAEAGVSIYLCDQATICTTAYFGSSPVVDSADVGGDGAYLSAPAAFLVDPLNTDDLLIATCRIWRGPASGSGWSSANAISGILDTSSSSSTCYGDGQVRALAAMKLSSTTEVIYLGMYGSLNGGGNLGGHVLKATFDSTASSDPTWTDITSGTVSNSSDAMNEYGFDVSDIFIDTHDATGNTVYVTVAGFDNTTYAVETLYKSTNGGANWTGLMANLPLSPANAVVVDPQDSGTVYVGTDTGVYYTSSLSSCVASPYVCWTAMGSGLPQAPVVALSAAPSGASNQVLVAGTFGRGIWQTDLVSAGATLTDATVLPTTLNFGSVAYGNTSAAQTVTVSNNGALALKVTAVEMPSSDFLETDTCQSGSIAAGSSCTIAVSFRPTTTGAISGTMLIKANVYGGQLNVTLNGTGTTSGSMTVAPVSLTFGSVAVNTTSAALQVMATNSGTTSVAISSAVLTTPFVLSSDSCSGTTLAASSSCQMKVEFAPTTSGAASGTLTLTDTAGTQTVNLSGTGAATATDALSPTSLIFASTAVNTHSSTQTITLTNSGGVALTGIALTLSSTQFEESSTCGTTLAAGSSCAITVTFAPTATGAIRGTLTVVDILQTQTVSLTGTGVDTPTLGVSPASMTFSNTTVGRASTAQTLSVTNTGAVAIASVGFQITGAAAASYSLANNTCGTTLAAGSICTVQVTFTPSGTGSISATLAVSSATTGVSAVSVPLNGSGTLTSALSVSPTSVVFGGVGVGLTSSAVTLTYSNSSSYSIAAPVFTFSDAHFSIAQNNCGSALAGGGSCTVTVIFVPTAVGSSSGTLTATSSTVTNPAVASLSGIGFDFAASVSGYSSKTVAAGTAATYNIDFNTLSGVTGTYTYTYACGTLPGKAACSFSSGSTTTVAGTSGEVTLTVSTGTAKTSALQPGVSPWQRTLPLLCGLLLLPLGWRRRRHLLTLFVLLMVVLGLATSCASAGLSGSSGSSSSGTTPTGTYTIPVTVTSTGISHTVSLTLIVD